ncbi:transposase [Candidatus Peregrinibacteria bacterium]|nr:transposase [Candidatus Peregrinibacteria bacterium]
MMKYIHDTIQNTSRSIFKGFTRPQKKAVTEVIRGLFVAGEPILRRLAQHPGKSPKRQGDKYSFHLGNIDLPDVVDEMALKRVKNEVKKNTIIAYDLTDISKESAKRMEKLSWVHDGSTNTIQRGYTLHGVGVNGLLLKLRVHEGDIHTINQTRKEIVKNLSRSFGGKGIFIFDRGNDGKQFFVDLRQEVNTQFISRLREKRLVVMKETGAIIRLTELPEGVHEIYLMNKNNTSMDRRFVYTLVIRKHLEKKPPIHLLCHLNEAYTSKEIVEMYLQRWGVENLFKRAKQKFFLEKIRVLKYQKFVNLVALIQFATNVSAISFFNLQRLTNSLISGALLGYRLFIKKHTLSFCVDSFITFLHFSLRLLAFHIKKPPNQQNLFSNRQLEKLVPF